MILIAVWLLAASPQQAAAARCASCHLANLSMVPGAEHLGSWQRSAHAKHDVGCDKCHGGNPDTYEPREAHRGVLPPSHPMSPVNGTNLVRTCAPCHERIALAFATTLHETLVEAGDSRAPTCLTCHGVMSERVPSPETLQAKCAGCHPPGSARGEYPAVIRAAAGTLNEQRMRADALEDEIERLTDSNRRVTLLIALYGARTLLREAVAAVHRMDPRTIADQSAAAKARLDLLDARITER